MVIIYTPRITDRLSYILDEIFTWRLGVTWHLTDNPADFENATQPVRINYSASTLNGLQVPNSGFLETTGILPSFHPAESRMGYHPVLFPANEGLGFDVFAMAFWFLSRYEEYQPYAPDVHGRFTASASLLNRNGMLEAPVLDMALQHFYEKAGLQPDNKYASFPTLDIDMAFKYRGKGLLRNIMGLAKDLVGLKLTHVIERIAVSFGQKDPWDVYDWLDGQLQSIAGRSRFFVHAGPHGTYDKAVPLGFAPFRKLLVNWSAQYTVGVHPGYAHGNTVQGILSEATRLGNYSNQRISRSRHHFLRMKLPETYRNLIQAGITHDYTMGFADQTGFRAGTGHSFRWYDLENETATHLVVHPFCLMDVTLRNYEQLKPEEACEKVHLLQDLCKRYGVPFCFIFHNESLSEKDEWAGWRRVFLQCLG